MVQDFNPPIVSPYLSSLHVIERGANMFPLYLKAAQNQSLFDLHTSNEPQQNLSEAARKYLAALGANEHDLFYHIIALLHAPDFRAENAGALRQDWPRSPLPATLEALQASAALGQQSAALLDPETPVPGVTAGNIRTENRTIGAVTRVGGGSINPMRAISN